MVSNTFGTQARLDFLGLNLINTPTYGIHTQLRRHSFICGIIYHDFLGKVTDVNTFIVNCGKTISFIYLGAGLDIPVLKILLDTLYNRMAILIRTKALLPSQMKDSVYEFVGASNVYHIEISPNSNMNSFLTPDWWAEALMEAFTATHIRSS